jgi:hypothetical protein
VQLTDSLDERGHRGADRSGCGSRTECLTDTRQQQPAYGSRVTENGVGTRTFNVGGNGDANDAGETSYRTMANNLFTGINQAGDV